MSFSMAMPWNEGEQKMHKLMRIPDQDNPTSAMLTAQAVFNLQCNPLLAIGILDSQKRPWTTIWGGQSGSSESLGNGMVGTRTIVDGANDPVVESLVGEREEGEMVQGNQQIMSGLTINLMSRKRVKLAGRIIATSLNEKDIEYEGIVEKPVDAPQKQTQLQLVTKIEESLGNCPKYLNQYEIKPALANPRLVSYGASLSEQSKKIIERSDMFFISTTAEDSMDTNHRGGPAGFVRISSDRELVYPEYSGNRLYQSLGNLQINPKIGITFPNYETGDVVYITGSANILVENDATSILPGSNLVVKITIEESRTVEQGLPFRGTRQTPSPYNPLVRTLASEGNIKTTFKNSHKTARLVGKTHFTSSIARFIFRVPDGVRYAPGQWIALDFSNEMDHGYSHMRDDDPRSLNDDWVRTFTISSTPKDEAKEEQEFEMTIRNVGSVTSFLFRQNGNSGFEIPVLGVGGDFKISQEEGKLTPFIAGGVGITPLLGQLEDLDLAPGRFKLLWTARLSDIGLVVAILQSHPDLAKNTHVFFTGSSNSNDAEGNMQVLESMGAETEQRRLKKDDLDAVLVDTWYLCAAKPLRKELLLWLDKKRVIFEDFDY